MPQPHVRDFDVDEVAADVVRLRIAIVNVFLIGATRGEAGRGAVPREWVLVDAGLPMGAAEILRVAAERFGVESRPSAIVLTHGHFDHVGALAALLGVWDVPVYAHTAELPFLTGRANYPPPDPTVAAGILGRLAPPSPEEGIDLRGRIRPLSGGRVPGLPDWRWIHTPGHSPGHISLFRTSDRLLLAGDAVATTVQDAIYGSLEQPKELTGPPAYFTIDWHKAEASMATLASLRPSAVAPGHGETVSHPALAADFALLARDFDTRVRPTHGRYVIQPALTDETERPRVARHAGVRWGTLSGGAAAAFAGTWLYRRFRRRPARE